MKAVLNVCLGAWFYHIEVKEGITIFEILHNLQNKMDRYRELSKVYSGLPFIVLFPGQLICFNIYDYGQDMSVLISISLHVDVLSIHKKTCPEETASFGLGLPVLKLAYLCP